MEMHQASERLLGYEAKPSVILNEAGFCTEMDRTFYRLSLRSSSKYLKSQGVRDYSFQKLGIKMTSGHIWRG